MQAGGLVFTEDQADCDGASSSVILAAACNVPISSLLAAPYNLPWGSSIYAKVTAINIVGSSLASIAGNGAVILTSPDPPQSLDNDEVVTNKDTIGFSWQDGNADGGTPVIDYQVIWDQGTNNFLVLESNVLTKSYTLTGSVTGVTYIFKIKSRTAYGYSIDSAQLAILSAQEPDVPATLSTDTSLNSAGNVIINWSPAQFDGGAQAIDYEVWIYIVPS